MVESTRYSWKEFSHHKSIITPLDESLIPNFAQWICWNGFRTGNASHPGFDFALYEDRNGKPCWTPDIPVRAVADGTVERVNRTRSGYWVGVDIGHIRKGQWLGSNYGHIVPNVHEGERVSQGQILGKLFNGKGRLIHLHFGLTEPAEQNEHGIEFDWDRYLFDGRASKNIDPAMVFPFLNLLSQATPQANEHFTKIIKR